MGKAVAVKLLAEGHAVYAVARREERMRDLAALGAVVVAADVTVDDDLVRLVERVTAERGGVDVLVNNAGFGLYGAVEDVSLDDARRQFEVNLFGLARLTQLVLPGMRRRGSGRIVNMSSMGGKIYTPLGAWYHATKHAVEGWSDCLRLELAPLGIDVIVIEPGLIDTEFADVVTGPLLARSAAGAYATLATKVADSTRKMYAGGATPPSVIADVIEKAVTARRPRTRYAAGRYAKILMATRKWLGDRVYDRSIMARL
ncbi:SDR family NAD(P)-dependent oxidoreductase [Dactylosporangium aurantiacum]|uniref:SDR family NAD(P)-dependent oxidoreductase n=2 Tax=Dactylosporangium aurantiacum TaxID=35754 RepID=A0A9Q9MM76_9ACTN|nr:SDR family NAD(P)-dependent oxidoreductase [Dactylosporangium aurantiacum]